LVSSTATSIKVVHSKKVAKYVQFLNIAKLSWIHTTMEQITKLSQSSAELLVTLSDDTDEHPVSIQCCLTSTGKA